jgi:topoisomerase IA-like protein
MNDAVVLLFCRILCCLFPRVNNGKYGYFLTCGKKNDKIPEFLLPEEVTLDMAKRLIANKQKISEEWLEKINKDNKDESNDETSEDPI